MAASSSQKAASHFSIGHRTKTIKMVLSTSLFLGEEDSDNAPNVRHLFYQHSDSSLSAANASEAGSAFDPDDIGIKDDDNEDDEDPNALHCICRTQAFGEMIACDGPCGVWFHAPCLSLRAPDIKAIKEFYCEHCTGQGHGPTTWNGTKQQAKMLVDKVERQTTETKAVGQLQEFATRSTFSTRTTKSAGRATKGVARAMPVQNLRQHRMDRERGATARLSVSAASRRRFSPLPNRTHRAHLSTTRESTSRSELGVSTRDILSAAAAAGTASPARKKLRGDSSRKKQTNLSPIVYSVNGDDVDRPGMMRAERGIGEGMAGHGEEEEVGTHKKKMSFIDVVVKEAMEMALFGVISPVSDEE